MMPDTEIKPSFSGRYIVLTVITSVIIAGVTFGINTISKSKPVRQLVVYESSLADLMRGGTLPNSQIEAIYYLSGDPKKQINSLFRKTVTIKNVGNEGVENLSLTIGVEENEAFLVSSPMIESSPQNIKDALNLFKQDGSSNKKHLWNIPLLNQGESLTFEYNIYSSQELNEVTFSAIPRKKIGKFYEKIFLPTQQRETYFRAS